MMKHIILCSCILATSALKINVASYQSQSSNVSYRGIRIVGTGWKKTGTTSLEAAYHKLGLVPVAAVNDCRDPNCLKHYAGTEDTYTCCSHTLVNAMKDKHAREKVKFVHTERQPEKWIESVHAWLKKPEKRGMIDQYGHLMGAKYGSPEFLMNYIAHNRWIRDLFADDPDRLLILNLEDDDPVLNMQKFCKFVEADLSRKECNEPFPHKNGNLHKGGYKKDNGNLVETTNMKDIFVEKKWLHVDEVEDEHKNFDWELATRDWIMYYQARHKSLPRITYDRLKHTITNGNDFFKGFYNSDGTHIAMEPFFDKFQ